MNDMILPHCFDNELGLLNACFCPGGLERVIEIVEPDDFYSEAGKQIFEKMVAFNRASTEPTPYQMDKAFQDTKDYLMIRNVLDELRPITAEVATHYAKIIKELSERRKAIKQAYTLYLDLHDPTFPIPSTESRLAMAGVVNG